MSSITSALELLDQSIQKLDGAVGSLEQQLQGQQRDMFDEGADTKNGQNSQDVSVVANDQSDKKLPKKLVVSKIDSAIEKVEKLLAQA